jgi:hypothetical protein
VTNASKKKEKQLTGMTCSGSSLFFSPSLR